MSPPTLTDLIPPPGPSPGPLRSGLPLLLLLLLLLFGVSLVAWLEGVGVVREEGREAAAACWEDDDEEEEVFLWWLWLLLCCCCWLTMSMEVLVLEVSKSLEYSLSLSLISYT